MSWDNGDNKNSGPWGKGPSGGNNDFGNSELDNILKALFKMIGGFFPGGASGGSMNKKSIFMLILLFFAVWGATGIYKVQPDEQGIVLRFGEFTKTTPDGLHYHLPFPIEKVITPKVTRENQIEVGVRTAGEGSSIGRGSVGRDIPEESLMLTGDENIVDVDFSVQWVISNAGDYLFNIQDPEATVKAVAESSMREVVGGANLQQILTEGREQNEAAVLELMQKTLDEYGAGISVRRVQLQKVDPPEAVIGAFRDVQAARADQERLQNEADAYTNRVIPAARGESARLIEGAEGYKNAVIADAKGQAARFLSIYEEYSKAPIVTRQRMYLETLERVYEGMDKIIIDQSEAGGPGVVPYLPLDQLQKRNNQEIESSNQ
ncbi:FtsH protease activity modulator HflK [Hyphomicrobiales bacterium]|jgi:membrane protease subunit HflK|nr:FtsH protease activity modulator HflK [Rhodobiaceae bacterium]MBT5640051.1 FtsH protease activity modulator HflK [Rhodobiaceae bacterium]MDC0139757.1 FtsH protease activity modulator HflK [Hyphomicrobiales bacterium]